MTTILRVKRPADSEPLPALVVSYKRRRIEGATDDDTLARKEEIFKLSASSKPDTSFFEGNVVDVNVDRERAFVQSRKRRHAAGGEILEKVRQLPDKVDAPGASPADTLRAVVGHGDFAAFLAEFDKLYDEEGLLKPEKPVKAEPEAVFCNGEQMVRVRTEDIDQASGDWLYDYYVAPAVDGERTMDDMEVRVLDDYDDPPLFASTFDDEEERDDDEDSNDENYFLNDYPDEEDDEGGLFSRRRASAQLASFDSDEEDVLSSAVRAVNFDEPEVD